MEKKTTKTEMLGNTLRVKKKCCVEISISIGVRGTDSMFQTAEFRVCARKLNTNRSSAPKAVQPS